MRILATLLLALTMLGCGDSGGDELAGEKLPFKIGILTGTVSQGEDEYRGAEQVIAEYGDKVIIHRTYPDNFMTEQETTVSQLTGFASDPLCKAIIMAQAVPGAIPAIKQIREQMMRKDIVFILIAPQEDPQQVARYADLSLNTDDLQRGRTIVDLAHEMGAKKFLHYTFPRHMSMEILAERKDLMQQRCEELGLDFIMVNAPDPTGDQGTAGAQKFILEDVPRQVAQHGKDIAVFSTNCSMQEPLIRAALETGCYFPEQCCPSPTHGYPGALGIEIPEEKAGDWAFICEAIKGKVAEGGQSGHFGTWPTSLHIVFIKAAVELAAEAVKAGNTDMLHDLAHVEKVLEESGDIEVSLMPFQEKENYFMCIADSIVF